MLIRKSRITRVANPVIRDKMTIPALKKNREQNGGLTCTCVLVKKKQVLLQRSMLLRMVLLRREQRQDQVEQENRGRKSSEGYFSVVLWNTTIGSN